MFTCIQDVILNVPVPEEGPLGGMFTEFKVSRLMNGEIVVTSSDFNLQGCSHMISNQCQIFLFQPCDSQRGSGESRLKPVCFEDAVASRLRSLILGRLNHSLVRGFRDLSKYPEPRLQKSFATSDHVQDIHPIANVRELTPCLATWQPS